MSEMIKIENEFDAIVLKDKPIPRLRIVNEEWYRSELNKFEHEEGVSLNIGKHEKKRTAKQNRYYHGVYLPKVSKETGEPNRKRLHELFKLKFLLIGEFNVLGQNVIITKSTTELSTGEFSKFIRDIESDTGVIAPPTENWGLPPLSAYDDNECYPQQQELC